MNDLEIPHRAVYATGVTVGEVNRILLIAAPIIVAAELRRFAKDISPADYWFAARLCSRADKLDPPKSDPTMTEKNQPRGVLHGHE